MAERSHLDPRLGAKWDRIEARLRARGWRPFLIVTHRTQKQQKWLYDNGYSRVSWGYHLMLNERGEPAALALDAGDSRYEGKKDAASQAKAAAFYAALGEEAAKEGLVWGGSWSKTNPVWARYGLGWDPPHVQLLPNDELEATKERYDRIVQALASRRCNPPEKEGTV